MSFSIDLSKFSNLVEDKMELVVKKSFIELSTDIIKDTPVLSGRLRNSWFVGVDEFADGVSDSEDKSDKVIADVIRDTNEYKIGKMLTLTNNMSYAKRIEFEGWSKKSPKGMVRLNLLRWNRYLEKQSRKLN